MLNATMNGEGSERTLPYFDPVSASSTCITVGDLSPDCQDSSSDDRLLDSSSERPHAKKPLPPIIRTALTKKGMGMSNTRVAVLNASHPPLEMSTQLSIQSSTSSQITETAGLAVTEGQTEINRVTEGGT
jgi:hypothetical protein